MSDLIDKQVVLDTIHLYFTEEIDKIPTKKTEDGEVYVIHKCQPLFEMNKAICKRIKALPSVSPTQNCVGNALDMRCDDAISRDAVWDVMQELWGTSGELIDRLMTLPSVNPQEPNSDIRLNRVNNELNRVNNELEPKTGHWSRKTKVDAYDIAGVKTWGIKCQCDRCDFTTIVVEDFGYYKYCPNCGCRMVEPQESEDKE